jgi:hypothetical protein
LFWCHSVLLPGPISRSPDGTGYSCEREMINIICTPI